MAAQCGVNSPPYVSSNAYYGYVPVPAKTHGDDDDGMDVDFDDKNDNNNLSKPMEFPFHQQQQQQQQLKPNVVPRDDAGNGARKRNFGQEEQLSVYMPRFKRFREGNWTWTEERGLSQMYNEPLLRLSPTNDTEQRWLPTVCQRRVALPEIHSSTRSQELEDMLLLTHGCSSYHHYKQNQVDATNDEAEF